jgi:hypothetical protein
MLNDMELLEDIINQVNQLSPEYRLRLIQRVTETLITVPSRESKPLQYGKYKGNRMSTIADFAIAEWHPTDEELDGTEIYP